MKEHKKLAKLKKANNFDIRVLLEESEGADEDEVGEDNLSQNDSTKELKRVLNSVSAD